MHAVLLASLGDKGSDSYSYSYDGKSPKVPFSDRRTCSSFETQCGATCCRIAEHCVADSFCCGPAEKGCGTETCCGPAEHCINPDAGTCCGPTEVGCNGECCTVGGCTKSGVCCPAGHFAGDDDTCHAMSCETVLEYRPTLCSAEDKSAPTLLSHGPNSLITLHRRGHHACAEFPSNCQKVVYNRDGSVTYTSSPLVATGRVAIFSYSSSITFAEMCLYGDQRTRVRACEIELCELDAEMCGGDASNAVSDAPRHDTSLAALPAILVVVGMLALLPAMTTLRLLGTRRSHSML